MRVNTKLSNETENEDAKKSSSRRFDREKKQTEKNNTNKRNSVNMLCLYRDIR